MVREVQNNGPEARRLDEQVAASTRRSVYLPLPRGMVPTSLEVFDFAEQGLVTGRRDTTTVAPQALYLLNDPFVRRQALALAERLLKSCDLDETARVDLAYRLAVGRPAMPKEVERAIGYVAEYESAVRLEDSNDETRGKNGRDDPKTAAWASFCQALLGSAEFRYVR